MTSATNRGRHCRASCLIRQLSILHVSTDRLICHRPLRCEFLCRRCARNLMLADAGQLDSPLIIGRAACACMDSLLADHSTCLRLASPGAPPARRHGPRRRPNEQRCLAQLRCSLFVATAIVAPCASPANAVHHPTLVSASDRVAQPATRARSDGQAARCKERAPGVPEACYVNL